MTNGMKPHCTYLFGLACCLAAFTSAGLAGQIEASVVMEQARRLSDIWEKNAPAFHLKADLILKDENGTGQQGTYVESWISAGQWRRETVIGSFHRLEVASGDKRWLLDSSNGMPITAYNLESMLAPWRMDPMLLDNAVVKEKSWHGQALRCVTRQAYPEGKAAVCVDKATGALADKVEPVKHGRRIEDEICEYSNYQKFGEKIFPRLVRCLDGNRLKLEFRIVQLEPAENLSADLFASVDGAKESFNCQGALRMPQALFTPDPSPPTTKNPDHPVELLVVVGKNGKPKKINVVRSIDRDFDNAAMSAIQRWKFKPATCEGKPIDQEVHVEVEFHIQ